MIVQLALLYGQDLSVARLLEVALVVVAAFGARSLARLVTGRWPAVSWLSRAFIGFASTLALGFGALNYFERGEELGSFVAAFLPARNLPVAGSERHDVSVVPA
jgi:uncharacterized protein (DUF697 family)